MLPKNKLDKIEKLGKLEKLEIGKKNWKKLIGKKYWKLDKDLKMKTGKMGGKNENFLKKKMKVGQKLEENAKT